MSLPTLLTDKQIDTKAQSVEHIFDWRELLSKSAESTLMGENLVIKGDKLSKEAFLLAHLKHKKKCIETPTFKEPD